MNARLDLPRKLVHTSMGLVGLSFRWLAFPEALALTLSAVVANRWIMPRVAPFLLRPGERARGMGGGVVLYPAMVAALVLAFHDRLELAAAAWGLLAFGDGMASIVGTRIGRLPLPWNVAKTWGGLVAFVVFGAAGAAGLLAFVRGGHGANPAVGASFAAWGGGGLVVLFLAAAAAAGWAESVRVGLDDNVRVGVAGGVAVAAAATVTPAGVTAAAAAVTAAPGMLVAAALLAVAAVAAGGVGVPGALAGWAIASVLGLGLGWPGLLTLTAFVAYVILSSVLARRLALRRTGGPRVPDGATRRDGAQVVANLAVAAACAALAVLGPATPWAVASVAALATAAFDTSSSDIGTAWAGTTRALPSFRRVLPGTEGGVSAAGTAAGLAGAALMAGVAFSVGLVDAPGAWSAVAGASIGCTLESWAGSRHPSAAAAHNDLFNFANTAVGAASALLIHVGLS